MRHSFGKGAVEDHGRGVAETAYAQIQSEELQMDQVGEVGALDFLRLMQDYLERRLDVDQYRKAYFELSTRRVNVHDEEISRIIERAYGDADDYDPEVRLPYTIKELELRERVAKSVGELIKRGVLAHPADESG